MQTYKVLSPSHKHADTVSPRLRTLTHQGSLQLIHLTPLLSLSALSLADCWDMNHLRGLLFLLLAYKEHKFHSTLY